MIGYGLVNLKELVHEVGEDQVKTILSTFSCPQNKDVEDFLRLKAIPFARQGWAQTHLVFTSYQGRVVLIGYFALANKVIAIPKKKLPNQRWRSRASRFAARTGSEDTYVIPSPLIGQLGKNFTSGYNKLISGDELLKLALDKVRQAQLALGGKFVYLECEDKYKLVAFYKDNGFVEFGKRDLEKDERDTQTGNYLVQMLKYLDDSPKT